MEQAAHYGESGREEVVKGWERKEERSLFDGAKNQKWYRCCESSAGIGGVIITTSSEMCSRQNGNGADCGELDFHISATSAAQIGGADRAFFNVQGGKQHVPLPSMNRIPLIGLSSGVFLSEL